MFFYYDVHNNNAIIQCMNNIYLKIHLDGTENNRSSHPEIFCKKYVLKKFPKSTGKHLCQGLFFNKIAGIRPATLLDSGTGVFSVNFAKYLRAPFLMEHLWWPLLE